MISAIYAGLLALLFLNLSFRVIAHRRARGLSIGDGNDASMARAIRVQGNFTEYAPIGLILLVLAELQGAPGWLVHVMGLSLLVGRVLHAFGLGAARQIVPARVWGMILTIVPILVLAIWNIGLGLF